MSISCIVDNSWYISPKDNKSVLRINFERAMVYARLKLSKKYRKRMFNRKDDVIDYIEKIEKTEEDREEFINEIKSESFRGLSCYSVYLSIMEDEKQRKMEKQKRGELA